MLIVLTPLWFWEEPDYWPDTYSTNIKYWLNGSIFVYSPFGSYEIKKGPR